MKWDVITPPATPVVSFTEIRHQCRIDDDSERIYLESLADTCTDIFETQTQRSLVTRTIRATWSDDDPAQGKLFLPRGPVIAITSITDRYGNVLSPSTYEIRRLGTCDYVYFISNGTWPLTVTYTAGYGAAANVPQKMKAAILMNIEHLWRNRGAVSDTPQNNLAYALETITQQSQSGGIL